MRFLLLIRTDRVPGDGDHAEGFGTEADYQAWMDYQQRLEDAGAYVESGELEPDRSAPLVVPRLAEQAGGEGETAAITDPRAVTGFYLVEAADHAAAVELARDMPLYGVVEVRPLISYDEGDWS